MSSALGPKKSADAAAPASGTGGMNDLFGKTSKKSVPLVEPRDKDEFHKKLDQNTYLRVTSTPSENKSKLIN
jgi:hypothetical protein